MLSYRGYLARIVLDQDDGILVGKIVGIEDGVTFHAETVGELTSAFHEAVEDYIETCAKIGKSPQTSYSGHLTLDVDPDLHRRAVIAAEEAGLDFPRFAAAALETAVKAKVRDPV